MLLSSDDQLVTPDVKYISISTQSSIKKVIAVEKDMALVDMFAL